MITTGIPVTVAMFQWLSKYAAHHPTWFDSGHADHQQINRLFNESLGDINAEAPTHVCYDFLRWISVMVAVFDGGILSGSIRTFMDHEDSVTITWDNGIVHSVQMSGWDRATRNAVDYILSRSCGFKDFQQHTVAGLVAVYHYFDFYHKQLDDHVNFIEKLFNQSVIPTDKDLQFLILSTVPLQLLQTFYLDVSKKIPEDYHFEGMSDPVPAQMFFSQPVSTDMLVIDKVKMHYNMALHADIDPSVQDILSREVFDFLDKIRLDRSVWDKVQSELRSICNDQFEPRRNFLSMVKVVFKWQH